MPDDFGWVAIATFVLGTATVWLALETRQARVEVRNADDRRVLRKALAEQLENCRKWISHDPARGEPSFQWLRESEPRVDALQATTEELALQSDLVPYLVWQIGAVGELWTQIDRSLNWPVGPESTLTVNEERLPNEWRVMVERLQVAAAIVAGEARRRGFDDVASPYDKSPWVVPREWEERGRELMSVGDTAYRNAPPFPTDPAFAQAAPDARDRAGAQTGSRQRAFLHAQTESSRRFLRRR